MEALGFYDLLLLLKERLVKSIRLLRNVPVFGSMSRSSGRKIFVKKPAK